MFDIVFALVKVIPKTRNKFVEIVAVTLLNSFQICLPVKFADGRMSIKKGKICSYLICNIASLGKIAGERELFSY